MTRTIEALVDGNVLRPLESLGLPDHERVTITITRHEENTLQSEKDCYQVAQELGIIGVGKDLPSDLSTNPAYMEGFGES